MQQEQRDLDSISILPTPEGVVYGKKGEQRGKGIGCVNADTKHPPVALRCAHILEAVGRFGNALPLSPAYKAQINTQYTFDGVYGSPPFVEGTVAEWDVSKWDLAAWSQSSNTYQSWSGVTGLGYYGALRMKVKGIGGSTTFSSYHVLSEIGGVM